MNNNIYIKNTIDKIKSKQNTLNSLMSMISHYAQETDRKFDDILMENNIDKLIRCIVFIIFSIFIWMCF